MRFSAMNSLFYNQRTNKMCADFQSALYKHLMIIALHFDADAVQGKASFVGIGCPEC